MRFLHTADWHLGRVFNGISLLSDQEKILREEFLPLVTPEAQLSLFQQLKFALVAQPP